MVSNLRDEILTLDSPFLLVVFMDLFKSFLNFRVQVLNLFEDASLDVAVFFSFTLFGDLVF